MRLELEYKIGDATKPQFEKTIIVHCCNDIGAWGAGFVIPLGNRYPRAKEMYRKWHEIKESAQSTVADDIGRHVPFRLGEAQFVKVDRNTYVLNLIGQAGIISSGKPPIRYEAIRQGLSFVSEPALKAGYSVQMPMMGAGLAGGDWNIIEKIVKEELVNKGIRTLVLKLS